MESGSGIIEACDDCVIDPCPTVSNFVPLANLAICSGETVSFTDLSTFITGSDVTYSWVSSNGLNLATPAISEILTNTNCIPEVVNYNYSATCTTTGAVLFTSTVNVTVFPTDISTFFTVNETDVCNPTIDVLSACASFISVVNSNPTLINPGDAGTLNYVISYTADDYLGANECSVDVFTSANYNCPLITNTTCPIFVNDGTLSNQFACDGDLVILPDLSDYILNSNASTGFTIDYNWSISTGLTSNNSSIFITANHTGGCNSTFINAVYTVNCIDANGQTSLLANGSITLEVYPSPSNYAVQVIPSTCGSFSVVSSGNCPALVTYSNITFPASPSCPVGANGMYEYNAFPINPNNTCWSATGTETILACDICDNTGTALNCPAVYVGDTEVEESQCSDYITLPDLNTSFIISNVLDSTGNIYTGNNLTYEWNIDPTSVLPDAVALGSCEPVETVYELTAIPLSGCVLNFSPLLYQHTVTVFPPASAYDFEIAPTACGQIPMITQTANSCPIDIDISFVSPAAPNCPVGLNGSYTYEIVAQDMTNPCYEEIGTGEIVACENCVDCPNLVNNYDIGDFSVCSGDAIAFPDLTDFIDAADLDLVAFNWLSTTGISTTSSSITDVITNNNCAPSFQTYTYQINCPASGEILKTETITVSVFPTDISNFVTVVENGCQVSVEIDNNCNGLIDANVFGTNSIYDGQDFFIADAETYGTVNFEVNYINTFFNNPPNCVDTILVSGNYDCSSDCPNVTSIYFDNLQRCSGSTIILPDLSQFVVGGTSSVNYSWTSTFNNFNSTNAAETQLVTNTDCDPLQVTYNYSINCTFDNTLLASGSFTVSVYPTDISSFYTINNADACNPMIIPITECIGAISITPLNPTVINPGDTGTLNFVIDYANDIENCVNSFTESVNYICPIEDCPGSSFIPQDITSCDGESVTLPDLSNTIIGSPNGNTLTYNWTYNGTNFSSSSITVLTENPNCEPLVTQADYSIVCNNGLETQIISSGSVNINVYPTDVEMFVTAVNDGCSAFFEVDAGCADFISTTTQSINPGQIETVSINASFANNNGCSATFSQSELLNCPIICPTFLAATISEAELCGSGNVNFTVAVNPSNVNNAIVTVQDANFNTINLAYNGFSSYTGSVFVDANNNCQPIVNSFIISVRCAETNQLIANTTRTVTVYPNDIMQFISVAAIDDCTIVAEVQPGCETIISNQNSGFFSATPGTSGTATFCFDYNAGNSGGCFNSSVCVNSTYACADLGGGTGTGNGGCPVAIGSMPAALETCGGLPLLLPNLQNIISAGNPLDLSNVTYQWTSASGFNSSLPQTSIVATNNTCEVLTEFYNYTITCSITGSIIASGAINVFIYPSDISSFIATNTSADGCTTTATISSACGNNVVLNQTSQTAGLGTNGIHTYTASWVNGNGAFCVSPVTVNAVYSCGNPISLCPTSVTANASTNVACNNETISLNATSSNNSAIDVNWFDANGNQLLNPNAVNVSNFSCDPTIVQYVMFATCISDPLVSFTQTVSITVYPSSLESFLTLSNDGCNFGFEVAPGCEDNISTTNYTADPGEFGTAVISANYIGGNGCVQSFAETIFIDCEDDLAICNLINTNYCAPPLTSINICIECSNTSNLSITNVESLFFCSIDNEDDGDECFSYTPLPNIEQYTNTDVLTVDYCITGTSLCTTGNIIVDLIGCTGQIVNPIPNPIPSINTADDLIPASVLNDEIMINENTIGALSERSNIHLENWSIYPNPVVNYLNIELSSEILKDINVSIINSAGQMVYQQSFDETNNVETIDVQQLSNGIYVLILEQYGNMSSKKFIVDKN